MLIGFFALPLMAPPRACFRAHARESSGCPLRTTALRARLSGNASCVNRALAFVVAQFEREFLVKALASSGGNVSAAARLMGKERRAVGKLLRKYGIDRATFAR